MHSLVYTQQSVQRITSVTMGAETNYKTETVIY